jgi:hypothetical protein
MIYIVCGGRHYTDGSFLFEQMDLLHAEVPCSLLVEGGQRTYIDRRPVGGADYFAHEWAVLRGIETVAVYAKWKDLSNPDAVIRHNRRGEPYDAKAGERRNLLMFQKYRPGRVVGFSPSGPGTANMLSIARAGGAEVIELRAP